MIADKKHIDAFQMIEKSAHASYQNQNNIIPELVEISLNRHEGQLSPDGALMVTTGTHTGRSPNDKYIVKTQSTQDKIDWYNNKAMTPTAFNKLKTDMENHTQSKAMFTQDLYACAHNDSKLNIRVQTELAWHALFIRHLLRIPSQQSLDSFIPDYTIINSPTFKANPDQHECQSETIIAINMDEKLILIGGTEYAGEIKKAVFTILNYLLPEQNIIPMHCSANHAKDNPNDVAIFFGLSGTGKTTLSADSNRVLIGDDEHGWCDEGVFNFEGGCYAKTINLNEQNEPEIYATTKQFGTVIENTVFDNKTRQPDFSDDSLTANMRCAYSLEQIPNTSPNASAGQPKNIIMLTCDAFGVMPPVAKLTTEQAIYHFLNGFTAKIAGTERGIKEPQPTFSTCFGAPFMPRKPQEYGDLLRKKIDHHDTQCWLVNTGWTGGGYGTGQRISIKDTRTILTAILDNTINNNDFRADENFGFMVPITIQNIHKQLLNPKETWASQQNYDTQAKKLLDMFKENYKRFSSN
jgi:phosphoenolpyruvate carboxykinase (ATP)